MNYLKSIQIGIDYIESNLDFDIELSNVAKQAAMSQWHFQRIFKGLTNETLKTYIRSRRLANSLGKLISTKQTIIEIAVSAGYESQESFTRAFKASFKLTPNEYRKLGDKSLFLKKAVFDEQYLKHINQNISLQPEIILRQAMKLVGLKTRFFSVDSEKNNIAEKLPALWADFLPRMSEIKHAVSGAAYGVIRQTKNNSEQLEYFAAVEVNNIIALPEQMESIDIPLSHYATFTHRGNVKELDNTVNYVYSSWLLNSNKQHTSGVDLEIYGGEFSPDSKDSVIYYAIPVS